MPKYTVLTYIINDYEIVHELPEKDDSAEYLLITDDPNLASATWNVIYDPSLEGLSPFDKCYAIRFNCFKYASTDICLRVDASIGILKSLRPLIDVFEEGHYDAALMPHPYRSNFIEEYQVWCHFRNYDPEQARHCLQIMQNGGYDFNYQGLFQLCFSIQRRGKLTRDIDNLTLAYVKFLGSEDKIERVDQIPFSYIMNKYFANLNILPVSEQIIRSDYMQWYIHHTSTPKNDGMPFNPYEDQYAYMFNRRVKCLCLTDEKQPPASVTSPQSATICQSPLNITLDFTR